MLPEDYLAGIKEAAGLINLSVLSEFPPQQASDPDELLRADLERCINATSLIRSEQAHIRRAIEEETHPVKRDLLHWQYDHVALYLEWASRNATARLRYLDRINTEEKQRAEIRKCKADPVHWFNAWAWSLDPRVHVQPVIPMVPFTFQKEFIRELHNIITVKRTDLSLDKSRDQGASWMLTLMAAYYWLFLEYCQILFGSYKEELVDSKQRPDTLLEKCRIQLRRTPKWMLPPGFDFRQHAGYMKIINPLTEALIEGAAPTEDFGRAGRYTFVVLDEHAMWRFGGYPQWAATSQSSPCKISVATPKGKANKQSDLRHSGTVRHISLHWKRHPWKDGRWYAGQALSMTAEEIAQELDIDYEASQPGRIFPFFHEAYHVITWSEFKRVYGVDHIPTTWNLGRAQDVGTSEGHENTTAWVARPRKVDKFNDTLFFYRSFRAPTDWTIMEIAEGKWDKWNKLVAPGMWQREKTHKEADRFTLSLLSWEGESELRTYGRDCKRYPVKFDRIKKPGPNEGISEMRNLMQILPEANPFVIHPRTGKALMGRTRFVIVVDDPQGELMVDDDGYLFRTPATNDDGQIRPRYEIPLYHYPVTEKDKPVGQRKPFKRDDDWIDDARYLCRAWGPVPAEATTREKIENLLPESLQSVNLPPPEQIELMTEQEKLDHVRLLQARDRAAKAAERKLEETGNGVAHHWRRHRPGINVKRRR